MLHSSLRTTSRKRSLVARHARLAAGVRCPGGRSLLAANRRPSHGHAHPGRFVWGDLVTSDVAAAAEFYGKVFGWTFETYGGDDDRDTYTLALADGLPIGGMVFDQRAMKGKTPFGALGRADLGCRREGVDGGGDCRRRHRSSTHRSCSASAAKRPCSRTRKASSSASSTRKMATHLDIAGDVNEWYWVDLWTADVEKAATFYRAVVGYETVQIADDGPRSGLRLLSGGFARAGIMQKQDKNTSSTWLPYIRVADATASAEAAKAAGGKVLLEPLAMNRATVAIIADPTGAPVGIVQVSGPGGAAMSTRNGRFLTRLMAV